MDDIASNGNAYAKSEDMFLSQKSLNSVVTIDYSHQNFTRLHIPLTNAKQSDMSNLVDNQSPHTKSLGRL